MRAVVDTCGWIEWLTDGTLADQFAPWLEPLDQVVVPTLTQFELYKWVKRERDERAALAVVALTEQGRGVPLSSPIALFAADLALEHGLAAADAMIYATARHVGVPLVTADHHFSGLRDVIYFDKRQERASAS